MNNMANSTRIFPTRERIEREVIKYINNLYKNGCDLDSEDILIDGLKSRDINLTGYFILHNLPEIISAMDENFNDSNLGLGYIRFICKLMKAGIFNYYDIERASYMYGLNRHALETYTDLTYDQIIKIIENNREWRENNGL
jgi:hypothetical protein